MQEELAESVRTSVTSMTEYYVRLILDAFTGGLGHCSKLESQPFLLQ